MEESEETKLPSKDFWKSLISEDDYIHTETKGYIRPHCCWLMISKIKSQEILSFIIIYTAPSLTLSAD